MSKDNIADWDETPANNQDVGGISLAEGVMKGPAVNNAFREMMAQIKKVIGTTTSLIKATTTEFRSNVSDRVLVTDQVWAAGAVVTLTDAASIAVDMSAGINFSVTLGGNRALANPTNTKVGQSGMIVVRQDATGSRTLSFGSAWVFPGGIKPTVGPSASQYDVIFYSVLSSSLIFCSFGKAMA